MMKSYLLALDFDGTAARTFDPSPNKIDVSRAYELGVRDVFGEIGAARFEEVGGLKNRAPTQLVYELLQCDHADVLFNNAYGYLERAKTSKSVPEGKGVYLDGVMSPEVAGELLVRAKLDILLAEIGKKLEDDELWPRPCNNFVDFWRKIDEINQQGQFRLDTAIISSGHDVFIERTLAQWDLTPPNIIVTEDDVRGRHSLKEVDRRFKPGQFQLAKAHHDWVKGLGMINFDSHTGDVVRETRQRMMYFGDDPQKDGGLARRAGIPFGHYQKGASLTTNAAEGSLQFSDWNDISQLLIDSQELLQEGRPIDEIFFHQQVSIEGGPRYFQLS